MRLNTWSLMTAATVLVLVGCRGFDKSAAPGSAFPSATNVGPIPGGLPEANESIDPYSKDPVALQEGRRLFGWYNCSGCHGDHGGGGMGPSLRDDTWIYGDRDDQIFDTLVHGRSNGMPAWGSKIPEGQMWKLVAYIKSMRTPLEPEPPVVPAEEQIPIADLGRSASLQTHLDPHSR